MNLTDSPVAKRFDGELFKGRITCYFPPDPEDAGDDQELWHVKYDDGDEEDMDRSEVEKAIKLHECVVDQKRKQKRQMAVYPKGQRIRKHFRSHGTFTGEIIEQATESYPYYFVTYRDGDSEHIHIKDIHKYVSDDATTPPCTKNLAQDFEESNYNPVPMKCIMCEAHGRNPTPSLMLDTVEQFLPVQLKPQGRGVQKIVVAYIHACCALRAPKSPPFSNPEEDMPDWWEEAVEKSHGYEGLSEDRFDSTSDSFVPFSVNFSDWVDDFALYNYRMLLASVRRFDEGRGPPYNVVESRAALWRCDDRGSIAFCRMAKSLVDGTRDEAGLTSAETILWGAILYRVFNRLSTFSRWAAVKALAAKLDQPTSTVLKRSKATGTSAYEVACHGPPEDRKDEFHSIAASGVTLYGRHGYRDRWGKDFCFQQMNGEISPLCCVAELPTPNELSDFKDFIEWEVSHNRGVMTAEHQVQSKSKIFTMLQKLANNNCAQLRALGSVLKNSSAAQPILDELRKLDTVGAFFAWQIFSDLVGVQRHCQLFAKDEILPLSVIENSFFHFALFGPGARKGAHILDGGAADVCEFDRDLPQAATLPIARRILEEFPEALKRIKLDEKWKLRAGDRQFDLETLEHSLCGYYCVFHDLVESVIEIDDDTSKLLERIAREHSCIWSRRQKRSPTPVSSPERQGGPSWQPNPCTAMERMDLKEMVKATKNKTILCMNPPCKKE